MNILCKNKTKQKLNKDRYLKHGYTCKTPLIIPERSPDTQDVVYPGNSKVRAAFVSSTTFLPEESVWIKFLFAFL